MKFVCTQGNLLTGLSKVTPVAGRNTQLPVLNNVLLQLKGGLLHATCTDLEIGVHVSIPGKVDKEDSCTVAARKLTDYVQQLPTSNPVTMELKKSGLVVSTKGFTASFVTTADDEFPLLPKAPEQQKIILAGSQFCRALTQTLFAAARDNTRPEIHSVFVGGEEGTLTTAATDSFRLAEDIIELEGETPKGNKNAAAFSFLLPLYSAQEVVRLFADQDDLTLVLHDNHITVSGSGVELSSRLIEGKYPDYRQIIPTSFISTGVVEKSAFVRALKTLLVFLPRDSQRVELVVKPTKGVIELSLGGEAGQGVVDLAFDGEGEELTVLFNIQYLLEGAQSLPGESAKLEFVGSGDPAVMSPQDVSERYRYVVMPIQA
ncbi:DNA polymerase III subunit beta [Patescibacteria group bacterium]|nr:DNA polymerase III subunit beta [Patescibacteria group bacterium]